MMPTAPLIKITREIYNGRSLHVRGNHFLLKVFSQDDSVNGVRAVISDVLSHVTFFFVGELVGRWAYIRVEGVADLPSLIGDLNRDDRVEYAEPDLQMTGSIVPEDPLLKPGSYPEQWGLDYINLYEVWDSQTGDDSSLIGIIDSGVPLKDEYSDSVDLHDRLTRPMDHVDLDGSRFIAGYNRLFDPPIPWPQDQNGLKHGTKMAGIIAAKENNLDEDEEYIGTAGVNWGSPVYVTTALDSGNNATVGYVYQATAEILNFASNAGNRNVVINLSINYKDEVEDDPDLMNTIHDMFKLVVRHEAIICISAGNGFVEPGGFLIEQPATLGMGLEDEEKPYAKNVIVVGAINKSGLINEMSGRGFKDMVFAPGELIATTGQVDDWENESGSSCGAAHVTGLAALLWCEDPDMEATEVVKCIKKTCWTPTYEDLAEGEEPEFLSLGIVDAAAALEAIRGYATLVTPSIVFEDVLPGLSHEKDIRIKVRSCRTATFKVEISGHGFGILEGTYFFDPCGGRDFVLTAIYSSEDADEVSGTVTITWEQNPQYVWVVGISGARLARRISVFLVLDKSDSMKAASGIGTLSRLEVLKTSAGIFFDKISAPAGVGIVGFHDDADIEAPFTVIPEAIPGPALQILHQAVGDLAADGMTSIAAGILKAQEELDALPPEDTKAILVITDGRETHQPWLEDTMAEGLTYPIFAIGIGNPSTLQPETLDSLTSLTDGYTVLTGDMDDSMEYIVAEFLCQILEELESGSVAVDPHQILRPGALHRFPVSLGSEDRHVEVLLMTPADIPLEIRVVDPSGRALPQRRIQSSRSSRLMRFKFDGPDRQPVEDSTSNGVWNVEVRVAADDYSRWIKNQKNRGVDTRRLELHGAPYTFRVHTKSSIRMKCRTHQSGYSPGSDLSLNIQLTERGRRLESQPTVTVRLTDPVGRMREFNPQSRSGQHFGISYESEMAGLYRWDIVAEGRSRNGHPFRRECRLTGAVWRNDHRGLFPGGPRPPIA